MTACRNCGIRNVPDDEAHTALHRINEWPEVWAFPQEITREEAISSITGAYWQMASEFCVGVESMNTVEFELREALHALGVSDEEMGYT